MSQTWVSSKWGIWTKWVLATTLGWGVYQAVSTQLIPLPGGQLAHDFLGGALLGILQWLVLRGIIVQDRRWVIATALATPIAFLTSMIFGMMTSEFMSVDVLVGMGAMFGSIVGAAQWLVLRNKVPDAGWWIVATAGGMTLYWVIESLSSFSSLHLLGLTIALVMPGLVTGGVLVWLLQKMRNQGQTHNGESSTAQ